MSFSSSDLRDTKTCLCPATEWQQGDYSLSFVSFPTVEGISGKDVEIDIQDVIGFVVVTQTCDIVNEGAGKAYVTVCPLAEISESSIRDVRNGRSPGAAILENPPSPNVVVDLGRMASVHKSILEKVRRVQGFSTDQERMKFAESLERKFGRFAFPDAFNDNILAKLRDRVLASHGKAGSDHGKAYRAIRTARVAALPNWDAPEQKEIIFYFVLQPEGKRDATRAEISKTLNEHLAKLTWPLGFRAATPPYILATTDDMTASEWLACQPIDWDFISCAGRIAP